MPNICLVLEYDGSKFCGWQSQPSGRSIQVELHRVLELVTRQEIKLPQASGRTDAGVHARGQVVSFDLQEEFDLSKLARAVSHLMHDELSVLSAEIVPDDFHARYSAEGKEYSYTILNRRALPVLGRQYLWHVPYQLDQPLMESAAVLLLGEHDFSSFRSSGCCASSALKEITLSQLEREGDLLRYRVRGTGFLKQMVRNIVGTLVDLGRGQLTRSMGEILEGRDRSLAGICAPAQGLCLERVFYCKSQ